MHAKGTCHPRSSAYVSRLHFHRHCVHVRKQTGNLSCSETQNTPAMRIQRFDSEHIHTHYTEHRCAVHTPKDCMTRGTRHNQTDACGTGLGCLDAGAQTPQHVTPRPCHNTKLPSTLLQRKPWCQLRTAETMLFGGMHVPHAKHSTHQSTSACTTQHTGRATARLARALLGCPNLRNALPWRGTPPLQTSVCNTAAEVR